MDDSTSRIEGITVVGGFPMQTASLPMMSENDGSLPLPRDLISKFRRGTPRSREGCVACKARHVKCDEKKPRCKKCDTTGRTCEYVISQRKKLSSSTPAKIVIHPEHPMTIPYQPSLAISEDHTETRSFHFIRAKNLTGTFGRCEIDLWDFTVLQWSHQSAAVRTSLLALSTIYEVYESQVKVKDRTTITFNSLHPQVFTQYAKAVTEIIKTLRLNNTAKQHNTDRKAVLISCLIFTWIEIMLSNFDTAKWHLESGIKIIIDDIAARTEGDVERDDPDDVYGSLHRSFLRLKFQTSVGLHGAPMVSNGSRGGSRQLLDSLEESRNADLVEAPGASLNFEPRGTQRSNVELTWTLQGRLRQLERLRLADEAIKRKAISTIEEDEHRRSLTFAYVKLSRAVLSFMTDAKSNGPDSLQGSRYTEVLDIIEDITSRKEYFQPNVASLDFGTIPPLFFTLKWCKDISIKLRAYELLKAAQQKEGMWYRDDILAFVEQQGLLW